MRKYLWAVAAAALAVSLSVGVATATAGGGNSANAKACQKGGWMNLLGTNGPFSSEEACVSYAAQGGTFVTGTGVFTIKLVVNTQDGTGSSTQAFNFTATPGFGLTSFSLIDDNAGPGIDTRQSAATTGSNTVVGLTPAGWILADISCVTNVGASATTSLSGASATVILAAGGNATCTFTYSQVA